MTTQSFEVLEKVVKGSTLTHDESALAMDLLMVQGPPPELISKFLLALRSRGETIDEITGFAESILRRARPISISRRDLVDTCGTGGDGGSTFNISTAVALLVASCGVGVAKHGNRSVSSLSGSADVYEALGLKILPDPDKIARSIVQYGFGFLYAPFFHPAMASVAPIRKALGVRTVFNILGPLVNPARVKRQVLGVYDRNLLPKLAEVLVRLGTEEALLVASHDGLDEISLSSETEALYIKNGVQKILQIKPEGFGLKRVNKEELRGGDAAHNAQIIEGIFKGEKGPPADIVCLNAAAALWIGGKTETMEKGVGLAQEALKNGKTLALLNLLRQES